MSVCSAVIQWTLGSRFSSRVRDIELSGGISSFPQAVLGGVVHHIPKLPDGLASEAIDSKAFIFLKRRLKIFVGHQRAPPQRQHQLLPKLRRLLQCCFPRATDSNVAQSTLLFQAVYEVLASCHCPSRTDS